MRRIEHQDIDKVRWDELKSQGSSNDIFCKSWYLDICAGEWDALVWGDYKSVFPLPVSKKAGVSFLYLPFFVRQLSILGKSDQHIWDELLDYLHDEFKRTDICLPLESQSVQYNQNKQAYQELNLSYGYEHISKAYSKNASRLIKKSSNEQLKVNFNADPEKLIQYFRDETGHKVKEFQKSEYETLLQLMKHCLSLGKGSCLSLELDGEMLASSFYMENDDRITFLKSFVSETGKKIGASYYLMDQAIKMYAENFTIFDFGGSKVPSVAQFYKKFGAIDAFYLHLSFDNSPIYHKVLRGIKRKISR